MSRIISAFSILLAAAANFWSAAASAHPHVWVTVNTEVVYADGQIKGLKHRWTFDDMYTAMAIEGLDKNKDGTYDREELQELAQVNIDSLKEFDYFTYAKLGEQSLKNAAPQDYWLEHKDGILSLHFFLPLKEPLLAQASGFSFQIYDTSYYIAFDFAKDTPVKLGASAPAACGLNIDVPKEDEVVAKDLSEAFFSELGGNYGVSLAKTVTVTCAQS